MAITCLLKKITQEKFIFYYILHSIYAMYYDKPILYSFQRGGGF